MSNETIEKLVLALAAAVVGAFLKAVFDLWADSRKAQREREVRHEQRFDSFRLRQTELQRKYLLELQEEYAKFARFISLAYQNQSAQFREGRAWTDITIPDDIDEGCRASNMSVSMLSSRIHNEEVRAIIKQTKNVYALIAMSENSNEAITHFSSFIKISNNANDLMGNAIRLLDDDEKNSITANLKVTH